MFKPPNATRCNECSSFQGKRRYFFAVSSPTMALLAGLFSAFAAVLSLIPQACALLDPHSHTSVAFHSATEEAINVTAINTGRKLSLLRAYWIEFDDPSMPKKELTLRSTAGAVPVNVVPAGESVLLSISTDELPVTIPREQMLGWLESHHATLSVVIHESSDEPNENQTLTTTIPTNVIGSFIFQKIYGARRPS